MIDRLIAAANGHVKHRIWIFSDLQQSKPERASHCMSCAVSDFLSLNIDVEAICYLGDAVEGGSFDFLMDMTAMQQAELSKINAPIFYVLGNHDFDYFNHNKDKLNCMELPFYESIHQNPQWHVSNQLDDMFFVKDFGDFVLFFLTDHSAQDGKWFTTHGEIRGDASGYPYKSEAYDQMRKTIATYNKPVFTLSHYAFAGGNRPAPLFDQLLPLPTNVRLHFYGHAHIGDAVWAGKDCYRKIASVDNQPLVQINVASLENFRGTAIRSVILEWYDDDTVGVFFRNHTGGCWDDAYITAHHSQIDKGEL